MRALLNTNLDVRCTYMYKVRMLFLAIMSFVLIAPVFAHHGFAAEYDATKLVYVTGILTKVEWTSPHMYIYVDSKDADGKVTSWRFEGAAPANLQRSGTRRPDLLENIGKTVTVRGVSGKINPAKGAGESIKLEDGRELLLGYKTYRGDASAK
jgi:Family of unknown function (DUF6152)